MEHNQLTNWVNGEFVCLDTTLTLYYMTLGKFITIVAAMSLMILLMFSNICFALYNIKKHIIPY